MDNSLSLADISALSKGNEGLFDGNGFIILILFFLFFGFGGWNRNNGDALATASQVYDATNQQTMTNSLNRIKEAVNAGAYENARLIDNVNFNGMQNTNAITQAMNNGFNNVTNQISALGFQMSQCCCDLKTQMLQDKYDDVRNQLNLAEMASSNAVQTQNILGQLGRFYPNSPYIGYNGTTIS